MKLNDLGSSDKWQLQLPLIVDIKTLYNLLFIGNKNKKLSVKGRRENKEKKKTNKSSYLGKASAMELANLI